MLFLKVNLCSLLCSRSRFSRDHRMLVEPACGAALSAVYSRLDLDLKEDLPLVMVVCGGNMATFELFDQWKTQLGIK